MGAIEIRSLAKRFGAVTAYLLAGALLGLVAMAVTFAVGVPWLPARDAPLDLLDVADYASLTVQGVLAAALSGAIGVAIGAIVRNQVAAVAGTLVYPFVLEPALGLVAPEVAAYAIGGTQGALTGASLDDSLAPVPAGLVLAAWGLLLGLAGAELEERRDVV